MGNHNNKGRQLCLALRICKELPVAAERLLVTLVKRAEGPKLRFCYCCPPSLIPSVYGNHMDQNFCI